MDKFKKYQKQSQSKNSKKLKSSQNLKEHNFLFLTN